MAVPSYDVPNLVRDFGGVGDDNTLNDAAFTNFLAAAVQAKVGFMPPGYYRYTNGLYVSASTLRLYGAGQGATVLRCMGTGPVDSLAVVGPGGGSGLILEDFGIARPLNATPAQGQALTIVNNSRAILRRLSIDSSPLGIYIANSFSCILDELYLTNMYSTAISYAGDYSANGTSISRCSIFACGNGTGANGFGIAIPNSAGTLSIRDNDIESCWGAMYLANIPKGHVEDNWMERQSAFNILTSNCGADLRIASNYPN